MNKVMIPLSYALDCTTIVVYYPNQLDHPYQEEVGIRTDKKQAQHPLFHTIPPHTTPPTTPHHHDHTTPPPPSTVMVSDVTRKYRQDSYFWFVC